MTRTRVILVTILIVTLFLVTQIYSQSKKRVLVIHSYNTDFAWVNQVNRGIKDTMAKNAEEMRYVTVRYHYMDLRNHKSCDFYRTAINDVRLVIQNWKPHAIIIVDDIGQALVGTSYLKFAGGTVPNDLYDQLAETIATRDCPGKLEPGKAREFLNLKQVSLDLQPYIIFAGVNGDVDQYSYYQAENVAGIFEWKNLGAIRQTIEDIYNASPDDLKPKFVRILSDNSSSAASEQWFFQKLMESPLTVPLQWEPVKVANTFDEWKGYVVEANQKGAMILTANYGQVRETSDPGSPFVGKIIQWTEENAVYPVLGASTNFVVTDGGMLSLAVPGNEQGEVALQLALEVTVGHPREDMLAICSVNATAAGKPAIMPQPFCPAKQFLVGMNESLVQHRNLRLPLLYEAFSRETSNFREK